MWRRVLSILGDGCDDDVAAATLDLKRSTIQSAGRDLHGKLGIQRRPELVRISAQLGFVRVSAAGVFRPALRFTLGALASVTNRNKKSLPTPDLPAPPCMAS